MVVENLHIGVEAVSYLKDWEFLIRCGCLLGCTKPLKSVLMKDIQ